MEAVERFRRQVEVVDRIGLEDAGEIELLIRDYSLGSGPYPEEPFEVIKRQVRMEVPKAEGGDVVLGSGVVLSTPAWLVLSDKGGEDVQV